MAKNTSKMAIRAREAKARSEFQSRGIVRINFYSQLPADDLLPSIVARKTESHCEPEPDVQAVPTSEPDTVVDVDDVIPRSFATDINELNLLGENDVKETERSAYPAKNDCEFRIDRLNL